jgi:hypothetical protein
MRLLEFFLSSFAQSINCDGLLGFARDCEAHRLSVIGINFRIKSRAADAHIQLPLVDELGASQCVNIYNYSIHGCPLRTVRVEANP